MVGDSVHDDIEREFGLEPGLAWFMLPVNLWKKNNITNYLI
jgi:hypothetical protein